MPALVVSSTVPAAGDYEVEVIGWEGVSGSNFEVSYAAGDHTNDWDARWTLIGGTPPNQPVIPQTAAAFPAPAPPSDGSWSTRFMAQTDCRGSRIEHWPLV